MLLELIVAARTLRARPLFTLVAIVTLAVGIGSNAAIFSVINTVLLRPLPFPRSERLVALYTRFLPSTGYDFLYFALSGPEFADVRSRVAGFSAVAAYDLVFRNATTPGAEAQRVLTMPVTAEFFEVLGVRPQQGRVFTAAEAQRRQGCVAVVGQELAARSVEGGANPVGSTIRLDDAPCEVVGVMPSGFGFRDERVRIWTGLAIDTEESPITRQSHSLLAIARLREGTTAEQAAAQLQALRTHWSETYPGHYARGHFAVLRPLQEDLVGDQSQALWLLGGAVVFVMLIVCVNVAALLVSRTEARRREFAVRHALGAKRRRLVGQVLAESTLLSGVGGIFGVLLAHWLLAGLLSLYPQRLPVWQTIAIDHRAIAFSLVLIVVAGFLVGLIPALSATGIKLNDTLKGDARAATATRRDVGARSALVVAQLALSIVMLASAVLLMRSYQHLQGVDLGFDPDRVLTFTLSVPPGHQPDAAAARRLLAAIEDRLAAMTGAESAGATSNLPLVSAGPPDDFVIEGRPVPPPGTGAWNARYLMVTPRLFAALRIPLRRGRLLDASDGPERPPVAVVNETAVRLFWSGEDPVGRTIRYYPLETSPSIRIVGVVGDVRSIGPDSAPPPAIYVPYAQAPRPSYEGRAMTLAIRARGNPADLASAARAAVSSVDSGLPLANVSPMSAVMAGATAQPRFTSVVMTFFSGVAFFLAALSLYGILAYSVERRLREIGVRVALGADDRQIFRLVIGSGMGLAVLGISIGVPAAVVLTRMLSGLLSGVTNNDPFTYVAVVFVLGLSALMASYLPARRATRIDPVSALRAE